MSTLLRPCGATQASSDSLKPRFASLHNLDAAFLKATAVLLNDEWQRPRAQRETWLRRSQDRLPTSYILYKEPTESLTPSSSRVVDSAGSNKPQEKCSPLVLAHARVSAAHRTGGSSSQVSAIVTSVIVNPEYRGCNLGRKILSLVERECKAVHKFGRVVLWTDDKAEFYEKCGYHRCRPLHTVSKAVSKLDANGLNAIEAMLARQQLKVAACIAEDSSGGEVSQKQILSVADACDGDRGESSVWLSKRLIERFATCSLPRSKVDSDVRTQLGRILKASKFYNSHGKLHQKMRQNSSVGVFGALIDVPHERQIGPCCGIAALRCIRSYWEQHGRLVTPPQYERRTYHQDAAPAGTSSNVSMLEYAKKQGWSSDGEMFNATNLARLASSPSGGMCSDVYKDLTDLALVDLVVFRRIPVLISFDKSSRTQEFILEDECRGARAHWGIVRGVVFPAVKTRKGSSSSEEDSYINNNLQLHWVDTLGDDMSSTLEGRHSLDERELKDGLQKLTGEWLYVVLQHTASDQVSVVPFNRLVKSNAQLDGGYTLADTSVAQGESMTTRDAHILTGLGYVRENQSLSRQWVICTPPFSQQNLPNSMKAIC